jgi:hypothetical protein
MQALNLVRDIQGYPATSLNLRPNAPVKASATLAASTEETFTVPSSAENWACYISFKNTVDVWVSVNATATVPAGGTFASTDSVRNPPGFGVKAGDVIHVITATATTDVGLEFFPLSV